MGLVPERKIWFKQMSLHSLALNSTILCPRPKAEIHQTYWMSQLEALLYLKLWSVCRAVFMVILLVELSQALLLIFPHSLLDPCSCKAHQLQTRINTSLQAKSTVLYISWQKGQPVPLCWWCDKE